MTVPPDLVERALELADLDDRDDAAPRLIGAAGAAAPRAMPICSFGTRRNCVVDGDTFWLAGEKIRIEGIDAPEVKGDCAYERSLAADATRRLSALLNSAALRVDRSGLDRHGRTLADVDADGTDVGRRMIDAGLAQPWQGRKAQWCGAS